MASNLEAQQDDVEIRLPSEWLRTTYTHCIERDVYEPDIDTLDVRFAQTRCTEMA